MSLFLSWLFFGVIMLVNFSLILIFMGFVCVCLMIVVSVVIVRVIVKIFGIVMVFFIGFVGNYFVFLLKSG